jgi:hypothetical protein
MMLVIAALLVLWATAALAVVALCRAAGAGDRALAREPREGRFGRGPDVRVTRSAGSAA